MSILKYVQAYEFYEGTLDGSKAVIHALVSCHGGVRPRGSRDVYGRSTPEPAVQADTTLVSGTPPSAQHMHFGLTV